MTSGNKVCHTAVLSCCAKYALLHLHALKKKFFHSNFQGSWIMETLSFGLYLQVGATKYSHEEKGKMC